MALISLWTGLIVEWLMFREFNVSKLPLTLKSQIWPTEQDKERSELWLSTMRYRSSEMALRMLKQSLVTTWMTMNGLRTMARLKLLSVSLSPLTLLKIFLKPNSTKLKKQDLQLWAQVLLLQSRWLQKALLVLLLSYAQTVLQTLVLEPGTNAILKNKLRLLKDSMRMLESLPAKPVLPSILSLLRVMNAISMLSALLLNSLAVLSSVSTQPPLQKILLQCFQSLL